MSINKIEILAPVGNKEMLTAAVYAGANAVYMGLQGFNARSSAQNFSKEDLKDAVSFCHARGVKVNVTLNTIVYNSEIPQLIQSIQDICEAGADAVLVQDFATLMLLKQLAPQMPLHGSTQMAVHTLNGALMLRRLGFSRVVIARECSKQEIEYITKNCGIETEVFVHGALCMSVSGQCYMSAFLGGRSGNRGSCAGPCRLPFSASEAGLCHLSLRDLSNTDSVKELCEMGVASVKIEGRLRTPEYVAAAVNACKKNLESEEYDKQLLQDVFSRSGFTNGYFENKIDGTMFGVRKSEDAALTKKAIPQLRELFRREGQNVGVSLEFTLENDGCKLKAFDGENTVTKYALCETQPTENDFEGAVKRSLIKTGGTPFFVDSIITNMPNSIFVPMGIINDLRRQALDELLQKRSEIIPVPFSPPPPQLMQAKAVKRTPVLHARFSSINQMPQNAEGMFEKIILPLSEAESIPKSLYGKIVLELPRMMFAIESSVIKAVDSARALGFESFKAGNIAHLNILKGCKIYGDFSLNISNRIAASAYQAMGCEYITISPEMQLADLPYISANAKTGIIGYGHLPLMITRACPLQNVHSCKGCSKKGTLVDRKSISFDVICHHGIREIFNPVPIYMAERLGEVNADFVQLYFTNESMHKADEICHRFVQHLPFDESFTRGLYYKGTN